MEGEDVFFNFVSICRKGAKPKITIGALLNALFIALLFKKVKRKSVSGKSLKIYLLFTNA